MAGGVQFHHTISTLLSQRDLKKMEKGRKKEICPPPPTHSKHTREGRRFPVWGSPPRRHRVASRQVKDNALDLDCGAHGRIGRRITTLGYSVRGFTPQGLLHTQHSGRAGGIHTYIHTQHTYILLLERLRHTHRQRGNGSLSVSYAHRDVSPVQARIFNSGTKKYVLLVSRQTRQ